MLSWNDVKVINLIESTEPVLQSVTRSGWTHAVGTHTKSHSHPGSSGHAEVTLLIHTTHAHAHTHSTRSHTTHELTVTNTGI